MNNVISVLREQWIRCVAQKDIYFAGIASLSILWNRRYRRRRNLNYEGESEIGLCNSNKKRNMNNANHNWRNSRKSKFQVRFSKKKSKTGLVLMMLKRSRKWSRPRRRKSWSKTCRIKRRWQNSLLESMWKLVSEYLSWPQQQNLTKSSTKNNLHRKFPVHQPNNTTSKWKNYSILILRLMMINSYAIPACRNSTSAML